METKSPGSIMNARSKLLTDSPPLYETYVSPQWVRLLDVLGMNADYDLMHASTGFWTEALGMARRVINVI
jgi:hypothetical protein